jgi:hypothetical protein
MRKDHPVKKSSREHPTFCGKNATQQNLSRRVCSSLNIIVAQRDSEIGDGRYIDFTPDTPSQ